MQVHRVLCRDLLLTGSCSFREAWSIGECNCIVQDILHWDEIYIIREVMCHCTFRVSGLHAIMTDKTEIGQILISFVVRVLPITFLTFLDWIHEDVRLYRPTLQIPLPHYDPRVPWECYSTAGSHRDCHARGIPIRSLFIPSCMNIMVKRDIQVHQKHQPFRPAPVLYGLTCSRIVLPSLYPVAS